MKAIILTVGDELLIGQVIDTNSAWIGSTFNNIGIDVIEILSVSDDLEAIKNAIYYTTKKAEIVIMTGGLGPTKDDITKTAIAQYFDVAMVYSEETFLRIEKIFEKFGRKVTEAHKEQCFMPANATLLKNKMGTAPGMLINTENGILVSLPGVPFEMKSIITDEVLPLLREKNSSSIFIKHSTIMTSGEGETFIADRILPKMEDMPDYIKLAYLPSLGSVRLRLTGKHNSETELDVTLQKYREIIVSELCNLVYGYDDVSLEESLKDLFISKGITLSFAESCTGGYLSHKITSVPGSSQYFMGSFITYSNESKMQNLGVKKETLDTYGAVSEETVIEMVTGLLQKTNTNYGISISGIAGPDGGSLEKPVGTIWIAISDGKNIETTKLNASKDRLRNIEYAATVAMNKLRLMVIKD